LPDESKQGGWEWKLGRLTQEIKLRLAPIARNIGLNACANGIGEDHKEWLYDMAWCEENDNEGFVDLPLVLESELSPDPEVDKDFQKLVQARADHRIFIFQVKTQNDVLAKIGKYIDQVKRFKKSVSGDRYLFIGLKWNPREFYFELYVHQKQ
jgi:hypothetical protein